MDYTTVVSLGYRCRTTFRLREYFGVSDAYPLDWWITSTGGAIRFLKDRDVDRLFDPHSLEEVRGEGGVGFVRQLRYGIKFYHDFPKKGRWITPNWHEHLASAKARTVHLVEKFLQLDRPDARVLIIREIPHAEQVVPRTLHQLRDVICLALPRAHCDFLLITADGASADQWASLKVDDPVEEPWTGDKDIWERALGTLGHRVLSAAQR